MLGVVREFAPAKINIALHVLGRRLDGYHELDSVVAFATVGDELEFAPSAHTELTVDGPFATAVPVTQDNLVLKAYTQLSKSHQLPPVSIKLTKNLPVASGIGGGSADAAAALRGLVELFKLTVSDELLQAIALTLGADVPVCLHSRTCRMQGVGERISSINPMSEPAILLVNPLQACSTVDVFRAMGLEAGDVHGSAIDISNPQSWSNDMTVAACRVLPVIEDVLLALRKVSNASAVRMSGSGATCFALFENFQQAQAAQQIIAFQHAKWWAAAAEII